MATPEKATRSRRRSSKKENEQMRKWRVEDPERKIERSRGIEPKSFHSGNRRRQRPGQAAVQELHAELQSLVLKDQKRRVAKRHNVQRSAFRQVSSLRTWPLQDRAFRHYNELMCVHMHRSDNDKTSLPKDNTENKKEKTEAESTSASSSGVSSGTSLVDEPKRILRDWEASPAQSSLKVHFREQFLSEQALKRPSDSGTFGCALWSMEPRVFATETSDSGKRKYVVGHLGRFMDRYWRKTDPNHRYYYELIHEKTPCRLYLDLEYSKQSNSILPDEVEALLDELLLEISYELSQKFGVEAVTRCHVVDLDSSTHKKFSRHWIFHLPEGALFAHTAAMGHFMHELVGRLASEQATGQLETKRPLLHKYLLVKVAPSNSDKDKQTCFIDLGVYTRNRLFRLLGSSKFGKPPSAALRIADANEFPFPKGFTNDSFFVQAVKDRLRMQQQVDNDEDGGSSDDLDAALQEFVAATDWSSHADALAETLVVPVNGSKIENPILPFDESLLGNAQKKGQTTRTGDPKTTSMQSYGSSPYPLIDDFVRNNLGARGGTQGSIRAWSMTRGVNEIPTEITYQMTGNRFCERIGRFHKSNNIFWTADLQLWHCVQYCHDPDCRAMRFRGTPVPLPQAVRETVEDAIFEEQLVRFGESELEKKIASLSVTDAKPKVSASGATTDAGQCAGVFEGVDHVEKQQCSAVAQTVDHVEMQTCATVTQDVDRMQKETTNDSSDDDIDLLGLMQQLARRKGATEEPTQLVQPIARQRAHDALSDDTLMDAVFANPELFP